MTATLTLLSERDRDEQRMNRRRSERALVGFRIIVADKAGLTCGQVIDVTTRGCGLRLTKPLRRGQYLTLTVYSDDGTASVICDLVKVQWVNAERAGVAFLSMSRENELRLPRLCGDRGIVVFEARRSRSLLLRLMRRVGLELPGAWHRPLE